MTLRASLLRHYKSGAQSQGRIYSQQGPVQKKMWGSSTGAADPIFRGKNWRHFVVITVCVSAVSSPKKLATFFCSSLSFHSGVAHFSSMQKCAAPFVGAPFCGAPLWPNMLNMPKSAAAQSWSPAPELVRSASWRDCSWQAVMVQGDWNLQDWKWRSTSQDWQMTDWNLADWKMTDCTNTVSWCRRETWCAAADHSRRELQRPEEIGRRWSTTAFTAGYNKYHYVSFKTTRFFSYTGTFPEIYIRLISVKSYGEICSHFVWHAQRFANQNAK